MTAQAAQNYLKTKVFTATPEQLQLMLYDGALRFGEQAKLALGQKNYEESYNLISRMQKIISELTSTLKHDIYPELCGKLSALYTYAYKQLIEANLHHEVSALDDAMQVLRYQRETWAILLEQLGRSKAAANARNIEIPEPDARMEAKLSMTG